jgi:hypothetical protein
LDFRAEGPSFVDDSGYEILGFCGHPRIAMELFRDAGEVFGSRSLPDVLSRVSAEQLAASRIPLVHGERAVRLARQKLPGERILRIEHVLCRLRFNHPSHTTR